MDRFSFKHFWKSFKVKRQEVKKHRLHGLTFVTDVFRIRLLILNIHHYSFVYALGLRLSSTSPSSSLLCLSVRLVFVTLLNCHFKDKCRHQLILSTSVVCVSVCTLYLFMSVSDCISIFVSHFCLSLAVNLSLSLLSSSVSLFVWPCLCLTISPSLSCFSVWLLPSLSIYFSLFL